MTPSIALGTVAIVAGYLALRATFPVPVRTFTLANTFARIPRVADVARGLFEVFGVLAIAAATRALYPGAPLWLLPMVAAGIGIASFTKDTARAYVYAFPFVFLCTFGRRTPGWAGRLATAAPAALFVLQMTRPAAGTPVVALALLNEAVLAAVTRARQGRLVADEAVN